MKNLSNLQHIDIPKKLIPPMPKGHLYMGVFLVFLSAKQQRTVDKKVKRIEKMVKFIKELK